MSSRVPEESRPTHAPETQQRATSARPNRQARTDKITAELGTGPGSMRDAQLRKDLVQLHMGAARSIAFHFRHRGISDEDLEQVAFLALTRAGQRFDASLGHSFLTFAAPTIRGEIRRYFRDHGWVIRPPRRLQELQYSVWTAENDLRQDLGRDPTTHELARTVAAPVDEVAEVRQIRQCFAPTSLDRPISDEDANSAALSTLLACEEPGHPAAEARTILAPAVRALGDRDRHILRLRFFDDLPQRQIAAELGVTQVQVSRLLARIYRDLRAHLDAAQPAARPCTPGSS